MVMRFDLSNFDKTLLPVTQAKTEQQNETGCKVASWVERVAKLEFYDPDQQQLEDYFNYDDHDKILSLRTVLLSVLSQRQKIWYAAAFPGTWLDARNENSFAKALGKIPELVKMKKTKMCRLYTIQCPKYVGKTIFELDDGEEEPDAKRQKSAIDF